MIQHSIHCRGYRGVGQPFVDDDCDCGATIENLTQRLAAAEAELDSRPVFGVSKCGHSERFLDWEDHARPITCTLCELKYLRDLNDAVSW